MKRIALFLCFLSFCLAANFDISRCPMECPDTEQTVWAMDTYCYVFRNKCHFIAYNCSRWSFFLRPLNIVTKEECQKHCYTDCSEPGRPVVEYYNNEVKHFNSICERTLHTCRTGETFL